LPALLGKAALVQHEDALRRVQARPQIRLEAVDDRLRRPRRLGQQALQGARCGPLDRLGHVLGSTPVGLLHEQAPHVLFAAPLRFLAPKERRELGMKGDQGGCHPVKLVLIHRSPLLSGESILKPSLQY
jgi:hypothetical protein